MPRKKRTKNTRISYLYRDADNYKVHNECVVMGEVTKGQIKAIIDCLQDGTYFIPFDVGLPEKRFETISEADHIWFELEADDFEITDAPATINLDIIELVKRFKAAKDAWNEKGAIERMEGCDCDE